MLCGDLSGRSRVGGTGSGDDGFFARFRVLEQALIVVVVLEAVLQGVVVHKGGVLFPKLLVLGAVMQGRSFGVEVISSALLSSYSWPPIRGAHKARGECGPAVPSRGTSRARDGS